MSTLRANQITDVAGTGSPTFPNGLGNVGLGVGQTWQNVTASRALGTTYTNTTGRAIQLAIQFYSTSGSQTLSVSGVTVIQNAGPPATNARDYFWAVIPPGATYVLSGGGALITNWAELR